MILEISTQRNHFINGKNANDFKNDVMINLIPEGTHIICYYRTREMSYIGLI